MIRKYARTRWLKRKNYGDDENPFIPDDPFPVDDDERSRVPCVGDKSETN